MYALEVWAFVKNASGVLSKRAMPREAKQAHRALSTTVINTVAHHPASALIHWANPSFNFLEKYTTKMYY